MPPFVLLATAFLEGLCVLLVEIVGARAMAPYFGTSLTVWTAQITATLLFLALGYRAGGQLSLRPSAWHLPLLFGTAGLWLILYRWVRVPLMTALATNLGIAGGSFASASALFGLPLLCLGAVSPVIIAAIDRSRPGAGSAAGTLFFTNTLGGLAGGWATAFLVIPFLSVTAAITATGGVLLTLALFWVGRQRSVGAAVAGVVAGIASSAVLLAPLVGPLSEALHMIRVVYEGESSVGTLQVVDRGFAGQRALLLDGVTQNEINTENGRSLTPFANYLDALSQRFAPNAKRALVVGLGAGALPRMLAGRGVEVLAVDIDPRIEEVARRYFGLPDAVRVEIADGRTFLHRDRGRYDIVILDVFAGETVPWHLTTVEAFRAIAAHLAPGGHLLINTVTTAAGDSAGLARLEAALLQVFPEVMVFVGAAGDEGEGALANATIVAGVDLERGASSAPPRDPVAAETLQILLPRGRSGTARVAPPTDEWSDVDRADADLRARWRQLVLQAGVAETRG